MFFELEILPKSKGLKSWNKPGSKPCLREPQKKRGEWWGL
jgi:hypothetical protein